MDLKNLKKIFIYLAVSIGLSAAISLLYIFFPNTLQSFDNRLRDFMFVMRGEIDTTKSIVIVDIDEKSLNSIGQWPWSRSLVSDLLITLRDSNAAIIGIDMVFAELDRTSPKRVLSKYVDTKGLDLPDYDEILANTLQVTPTILGYQFQLEDEEFIRKDDIFTKAVIVNKGSSSVGFIEAKGTILNTPIIQDSGYSSGFFNVVPDDSGIIRSVPLLIKYDNQIYPSISLEIIRILHQTNKIVINSDELGINSIRVSDIEIPTDRFGRLYVNFRGKERSFQYISAVDILNGNFNFSDIENRVILIGTSAAGLLDLRATPFDYIYPGVEVHANVIDNILSQDFISKPSQIEGVDISIIFLLSTVIFLLVGFLRYSYILLLLILLLLSVIFAIYYTLFEYGFILNLFFPIFTIFISFFISIFLNYLLEVRKEQKLREKFANKVSKSVMESILDNSDNSNFWAMDREVTIFFSDVRGFTNISESMPNPKALIEYLNYYMTPMTDIIIDEGGTVDKYIGDAIMAYWNAPTNIDNHQDRALSAAIRQIEHLKVLNIELTKKSQPLIDIGIGLNSGVATVGEMGSKKRSDYTVIGDSINLGSRLESLCKSYGARILISEFTKRGLKKEYQMRDIDIVRVKGKSEPVEIFEVYGFGKSKGRLKEELERFNYGVKLYRDSNFNEALEIFEDINSWEDRANIKIYEIYIKRCNYYISNRPINFDGVFTHTTKG